MESGHGTEQGPKLLPRVIVLIIAALLACGVIASLTFTLQKDGNAAVLLLDYSSLTVFPYPFTIQNAMHVLFFLGLVLLLSVVQKREEESVSLAGNYCLKNLVNRLYAAPK